MVSAVLAGDVVIRYFEPEIPPPSRWPTVETELKSHQLADLDPHLDVLFIGSSVTEAAVDPALLMRSGATGSAYNAALPFSSPLSDQVWLNEVILPHVTPSVVIVGIPAWPSHGSLEDDLLRAGIEHALSQAPPSGAGASIALVSSKGALADWDERRARQVLTESNLWTDRGHMRGYYDQTMSTLAGALTPYGSPNMSTANAAALNETIEDLMQRDIDVILLVEPGRYPGEVPASKIETYIDSIAAIAGDFGIPMWDTYHIDWDPTYYVDEAHFNHDGTVAFTEYLGSLLRERPGS